MSDSESPFGGPLTKLVTVSLAVYLSAAAVVAAVGLLQSIWPWLLGIAAIAGIGFVVFRTTRNRW